MVKYKVKLEPKKTVTEVTVLLCHVVVLIKALKFSLFWGDCPTVTLNSKKTSMHYKNHIRHLYCCVIYQSKYL